VAIEQYVVNPGGTVAVQSTFPEAIPERSPANATSHDVTDQADDAGEAKFRVEVPDVTVTPVTLTAVPTLMVSDSVVAAVFVKTYVA
jgi:hypothetical protein